MELVVNRIVVGVAIVAIGLGAMAMLAAAMWPSDSRQSGSFPADTLVAQSPLIEKERRDLDYQQRQNIDKARSDAAIDAARAAAELDAQRRAADLVRQQALEAERQRQLERLNRDRMDRPQPYLSRPYQ